MKINIRYFVPLLVAFFVIGSTGYIQAGWLLDSNGKLTTPWEKVLGVKKNNSTITEASSVTSKATPKPKVTPKNNKTEEEVIESNSEETVSKPNPGVKAEIKPNGATIRVRVMDENGEVVDSNDATPSSDFIIEEGKSKNQVKVRSYENESVLIKDKMAAKTNFPLMVDFETNTLYVTTPKGTKAVTVLPDAAVQHMLAANVLDQLGGKGGLAWIEYQNSLATPMVSASPLNSSEPSASPEENPLVSPTTMVTAQPTAEPSASPEAEASLEPETSPSVSPSPESSPEIMLESIATPIPSEQVEATMELVENTEGELVYRIHGTKNKKLFGIAPVTLTRTAIVSADTGELIKVEQNLGTSLLDFMSI